MRFEKNLFRPKSWIFQGNPERWDFLYYISNKKQEIWSANQNKDQMVVGDKIYYWMSGKNAGVYGMGRILSLPVKRGPNHENREFGSWEIDVSVDEYLGDNWIPRDHFLANPILRNSKIIKVPRGTNFLLSNEDAKEVEKLVALSKTPRPKMF